MPSAYLKWRFHSGERVEAHGPLVFWWAGRSGATSASLKFLSIFLLYQTIVPGYYVFMLISGCLSVHLLFTCPYFLVPNDNFCICQWIFTKLTRDVRNELLIVL